MTPRLQHLALLITAATALAVSAPALAPALAQLAPPTDPTAAPASTETQTQTHPAPDSAADSPDVPAADVLAPDMQPIDAMIEPLRSINRLWIYFGPVGIASIALGFIVIVISVAFCVRHPRGSVAAIAIVLALGGVAFAAVADLADTESLALLASTLTALLTALFVIAAVPKPAALGVIAIAAAALAAAGAYKLALAPDLPWAGPLLFAVVITLAAAAAVSLLAGRQAPLRIGIIAFAVAVFIAGEWNSKRVSLIETDYRQVEQQLAEARAAEAARKEERRRRRLGLLTAETSDADRAELEAAAVDDDSNEYVNVAERAAARDQARDAANAVPTYKQKGKQHRDTDRVGDPDPADPADPAADAADTPHAPALAILLPPEHVARANQWDRLNLILTRWAPFAALALLLVDYLHRFSQTLGSRAPLPISHRLIDRVFPKSLATRLVGPPAVVADLLREVVRKGETFIHLTAADPLPDSAALPRLPHLTTTAALTKQTLDHTTAAKRAEWVFESAWFNRLAIVITTSEHDADDTPAARAATVLAALVDHLAMRRIPQAAARRTVTFIWSLPTAPTEAQLEALTHLCRRANFRLVVHTPDESAPAPAPGSGSGSAPTPTPAAPPSTPALNDTHFDEKLTPTPAPTPARNPTVAASDT